MVETEPFNGVLIVRPQQDIVASYVEEFRKELQMLVEEGHANLAIDLAGVDIIDSKGLAVFMMCFKSVTERGGRLRVLTTSADLQHLFHVTRLDQHFTVATALAD